MYWTKTINNKVIEFQAGFEPVLPQLEISFQINEKIFDFAVNILNIFSFEISKTRKVDHAGVNIDMNIGNGTMLSSTENLSFAPSPNVTFEWHMMDNLFHLYANAQGYYGIGSLQEYLG